jgi:cytochrome c-type biogenesis protein CcmH/NrfF
MWLLVVFVVMRLMRTFLPGVIQLSPDFTWWLLVLWPSPVVFAVGWVAGVIAWFAILRQHDRAVLTVLAAIVAALISLLVLAMFAM